MLYVGLMPLGEGHFQNVVGPNTPRPYFWNALTPKALPY